MRILVFLSCLSLALGKLIVGGSEAPLDSRPYQVALSRNYAGGSFVQACGGTLVHRSWVVSAAHCIGASRVDVGLGYHSLSAGGEQIITGTWIKYPGYNSGTYDNDVALIKLDTPATITDKVKTIGIAKAGSDVAAGTSLLVSGWGALSSGGNYPDKLQQVVVTAVSRGQCNSDYGGSITNNMFCASAPGKDSCQNDSGGPIVSNFDENKHVNGVILEGIVSWGAGCADARYPGVYARAANYCAWFAEKSSNDVTC
ncbi:trypsin alpha-3-like [Patiria miniata]|uniref:Peptidase S1 domain-containing protein n=1 Tax=Patiria miniata TaxID=46514 RepID=A0A914BTU6_PATMI|nr:trypsin alpha-3-like [Patiria miniata]